MKYYLAHNGNDVFHYGKLEDGQEIKTGQPILKFFDTAEELDFELSLYNIEIEKTIEGTIETFDVIPDDSLSDLLSIEP
jgi:hypothetical protein